MDVLQVVQVNVVVVVLQCVHTIVLVHVVDAGGDVETAIKPF